MKLRGAVFRSGYHDFDVQTGGLVAYPRLVAAEHRTELEPDWLSSGVKAFDNLLGGGIHRGSATLLVGPAGAGKSIIATQFALVARSAVKQEQAGSSR